MKLFPRPMKATYRVLPGKVFIHPRTGERISEGVDFVAEDRDVAEQIYKLVRKPFRHRAILEPRTEKTNSLEE